MHDRVCNAGGGKSEVRNYLDASVVPVLRKGLRELVRARPDDPYQWLATYILDHKPSAPTA